MSDANRGQGPMTPTHTNVVLLPMNWKPTPTVTRPPPADWGRSGAWLARVREQKSELNGRLVLVAGVRP